MKTSLDFPEHVETTQVLQIYMNQRRVFATLPEIEEAWEGWSRFTDASYMTLPQDLSWVFEEVFYRLPVEVQRRGKDNDGFDGIIYASEPNGYMSMGDFKGPGFYFSDETVTQYFGPYSSLEGAKSGQSGYFTELENLEVQEQ